MERRRGEEPARPGRKSPKRFKPDDAFATWEKPDKKAGRECPGRRILLTEAGRKRLSPPEYPATTWTQ